MSSEILTLCVLVADLLIGDWLEAGGAVDPPPVPHCYLDISRWQHLHHLTSLT